eukprot:46329_1
MDHHILWWATHQCIDQSRRILWSIIQRMACPDTQIHLLYLSISNYDRRNTGYKWTPYLSCKNATPPYTGRLLTPSHTVSPPVLSSKQFKRYTKWIITPLPNWCPLYSFDC